MPTQTVYALGSSQVTVSGGGQLSGITQGDGSHLDGRTITLNSNAWEGVLIDDNDSDFTDNDTSQRLEGAQTFDGVAYDDNRIVEAEFSVIVEDSAGIQYTLFGFNIRQPGGSSFGTIEGLAFLENSAGTSAFPPIGEPLTVISTGEFPSTPYATLAAPPCFTPGTMIATPSGPRDVADLSVGDLVLTLDHGPQPIRWVGRTTLPKAVLENEERFRPVRITKDAFGVGKPCRTMRVSPQHRVFVTGWRAQLYFGADELLVTAVNMCNDQTIRREDVIEEVTYIHVLFDQHEVIWSDGLLTESYFPAGKEKTGADVELKALFPDRFQATQTDMAARSCLSDKRAIALSA